MLTAFPSETAPRIFLKASRVGSSCLNSTEARRRFMGWPSRSEDHTLYGKLGFCVRSYSSRVGFQNHLLKRVILTRSPQRGQSSPRRAILWWRCAGQSARGTQDTKTPATVTSRTSPTSRKVIEPGRFDGSIFSAALFCRFHRNRDKVLNSTGGTSSRRHSIWGSPRSAPTRPRPSPARRGPRGPPAGRLSSRGDSMQVPFLE
jgi:hypothetical protein